MFKLEVGSLLFVTKLCIIHCCCTGEDLYLYKCLDINKICKMDGWFCGGWHR